MKENSPFTPGSPVPVELFVGRVNQIKEILRYVKQTTYGRQENVFLSGERGIGKSSLASFIRNLVEADNFLTIHVFLGGVTSLEELVRKIFEEVLKASNNKNWFYKISDFFGHYIDQVGLFGVSLSFNPPKNYLEHLVRHFPDAINNLIQKIKDEKKGLFIALDDINGISKTTDFANWYKIFVDYVNTHYINFPVFIMPIGLPEIRDLLSETQPSLLRVFRVIDIDKLNDVEVREFYEKAFERADMKLEPDALDLISKFSGGLPIFIHEIGDAVFWLTENNTVTRDNAYGGILQAAERIGKKYLAPKVYRAIRSDRYRSILRKMGENLNSKFVKKEIENKLNEREKKVFNNFLRKLRDLGIIVPDLEYRKGYYKFVNQLYPIYIWMESQSFKSKSKSRKKK